METLMKKAPVTEQTKKSNQDDNGNKGGGLLIPGFLLLCLLGLLGYYSLIANEEVANELVEQFTEEFREYSRDEIIQEIERLGREQAQPQQPGPAPQEDDLTLAKEYFKDMSKRYDLKYLSAVLRAAAYDNGMNGRWIQFLKSKKGDDLVIFLGNLLMNKIKALGRLPDEYITKDDAIAQGWDRRIHNVSDILPGRAIGGSQFRTDDCNISPEILNQCNGTGEWLEADLFYLQGKRGAWRLVYNIECGKYLLTKTHYREFITL